MKVKLDFTLNKAQFEVIDRAIFQLVLNGYTSIINIQKYLYIFNQEILARPIRQLINNQLILADATQKTLTLSSPVSLLRDLTKNQLFDLKQTETTMELFKMHNGIINTKKNYLNKKLTEYVLDYLIPDVDLAYYAKMLNFTIINANDGERDE